MTVLELYLSHIRQREFLWGNLGSIPWDMAQSIIQSQHSWSLYLVNSSPFAFEVIFWTGLLVTLTFTLGMFTRISSLLFYVFTWSLYMRNPVLLDGGDNLVFLLAFFLPLTDCAAYFSLDALRLGRSPSRRSATNAFSALLHNLALGAIITQIMCLYFTSAFYKAQGHMWQSGTALYYILRNAEFSLSPLNAIFFSSDAAMTLATYFTVVIQFAWPFLIWNRVTRLPLVAIMVLFHVGIGYFMGLLWFSFVMISAELVVLDDEDYLCLMSLVRWAAGLRLPSARRKGEVRTILTE